MKLSWPFKTVLRSEKSGKVLCHVWRLFPYNKYFNIGIHHYMDGDNYDRYGLHDHRWLLFCVTLHGYGGEITYNPNDKNPQLKSRSMAKHRYRFYRGHEYHIILYPRSLWTLVINGPVYKDFNFIEVPSPPYLHRRFL